MKLKISFANGWILGVIALTTRLFVGATLDWPELHIAGWIGTLVGLVICMPLIWACGVFSNENDSCAPMKAMEKKAGVLPVTLLKTVLLAGLLWDAAGVSIMSIETMSYANMVEIRGIYFLLPLYIAMFSVLLTNGSGVGGVARLWGKVIPLLFLIVLIQRFSNYEFRWLRPFLGEGGKQIISGGISSAGWLAPAAVLWLIAEPDQKSRRSCWQTPAIMILISALFAAGLLALHAAMTPAQISGNETRIFRMDSILTNGRATLGSQLPVLILWYASQLITLMFELFLSAALLQQIVLRLSGVVCVFLINAAACALAWNGLAGQKQMMLLTDWEYLLIAVPFFLVLTIAYLKDRKAKKICEDCG